MRNCTIKKGFSILLSLAFCSFLFSSSINMLFTKRLEQSKNENRILATIPAIPLNIREFKDYFAALDNYLNDHFGFREHYTYRYQRELKKHFGRFSLNDHVIHGLDGWLFFNDFDLIRDFLGLTRLKDQELNGWLKKIARKARWLESQGIHYLYMVPPNKQTVYPQYVMKGALLKKGTSRYEQFVEKLKGQLPSYMIDLHTVLKAESRDRALYFKHDTHWNSFGAYLAFIELMKPIAAWYPDEEFSTSFDFEDQVTGRGGDLARLVMENELTETYPQLKKFRRCERPTMALPYTLSNVVQQPLRRSFIRKCRTKSLKVLVFRDSFFNHIEPYLSQNFAEIVYLWKDYDQQNVVEILNYFKPDVVIEEIVERHMFDQFLPREQD